MGFVRIGTTWIRADMIAALTFKHENVPGYVVIALTTGETILENHGETEHPDGYVTEPQSEQQIMAAIRAELAAAR